jgi:hypothetical protein
MPLVTGTSTCSCRHAARWRTESRPPPDRQARPADRREVTAGGRRCAAAPYNDRISASVLQNDQRRENLGHCGRAASGALVQYGSRNGIHQIADAARTRRPRDRSRQEGRPASPRKRQRFSLALSRRRRCREAAADRIASAESTKPTTRQETAKDEPSRHVMVLVLEGSGAVPTDKGATAPAIRVAPVRSPADRPALRPHGRPTRAVRRRPQAPPRASTIMTEGNMSFWTWVSPTGTTKAVHRCCQGATNHCTNRWSLSHRPRRLTARSTLGELPLADGDQEIAGRASASISRKDPVEATSFRYRAPTHPW